MQRQNPSSHKHNSLAKCVLLKPQPVPTLWLKNRGTGTATNARSPRRLSVLTITAYANLMFDVRGADRRGIWFLRRLRPAGPARNPKIWMMGNHWKEIVCFKTDEELEDYIDVLCGLDGKTMADGLPRSAPEFGKEFSIRHTLAEPLLPRGRPTRRSASVSSCCAKQRSRPPCAGRSSGYVDSTRRLRKRNPPAGPSHRSRKASLAHPALIHPA
jgi:hypothetical protein